MACEHAEDVGQSPLLVRELILQCVVMLLLQDAAREVLLDKVLDWLQGRRRAADPHDYCVAIAKSKNNRPKNSVQKKRHKLPTAGHLNIFPFLL